MTSVGGSDSDSSPLGKTQISILSPWESDPTCHVECVVFVSSELSMALRETSLDAESDVRLMCALSQPFVVSAAVIGCALFKDMERRIGE